MSESAEDPAERFERLVEVRMMWLYYGCVDMGVELTGGLRGRQAEPPLVLVEHLVRAHCDLFEDIYGFYA